MIVEGTQAIVTRGYMYEPAWLLREIESDLLQALRGFRESPRPTFAQRRRRLDVLVLLYKVRHLRKCLGGVAQGRLN